MEPTPKVKFIKYRDYRSKAELKLFSMLNVPLAGDWLNLPPGMDEVYNRAFMAIHEIEVMRIFKYANPLSLERTYNPDSVCIYTTGTATGKKEMLCGFIPFNIEDRKNDFSNFKPITKMDNKKAADTSQLEMIEVNKITPSPTNKLHREAWELDPKKDASFADLVKSVGQHGVVQPVLIRLNEKPGKFYLVCGERRLTAAQLAGAEKIPALIKQLNDDEAFELQIIENLQRKDVHPLKEAESYSAYQAQKNCSIEEMAAKFSKTKDYIAQRLSFMQLIPEFKKDFYAGKMTAGHAVLFARLTADDQKVCFEKCVDTCNSDGNYDHISEVKDFIAQSLMGMLASVPFSLVDAGLFPQAGSCAACPKRSGAGLFNDVAEKDRCFDLGCLKAKSAIHLANLITDLLANNPAMPVVKMNYTEGAKGQAKKLLEKAGKKPLVKWHDFDDSEKGKPGAIKALCISGTKAGQFVYIKMKKQSAKLASSPGTPAGGKAAVSIDHKAVNLLKIKDAETDLKRIEDKISQETLQEIEKKLFDFKPYHSADAKPLTKYEMTAFRWAMKDNLVRNKDLDKVMKALKAPAGITKATPGYEVELLAGIPADVHNFLVRCFIAEIIGSSYGEENDYLITKLAAENKAIQPDIIRQVVAKKNDKAFQAAKKALAALKEPAKPIVPTLAKIEAPKKAAVKKKAAPKKKAAKKK